MAVWLWLTHPCRGGAAPASAAAGGAEPCWVSASACALALSPGAGCWEDRSPSGTGLVPPVLPPGTGDLGPDCTATLPSNCQTHHSLCQTSVLRKHLHDNLYFITFSSERKRMKYNDTTNFKSGKSSKKTIAIVYKWRRQQPVNKQKLWCFWRLCVTKNRNKIDKKGQDNISYMHIAPA